MVMVKQNWNIRSIMIWIGVFIVCILLWMLGWWIYQNNADTVMNHYEMGERKIQEGMNSHASPPKCGIVFLAKNPVDFPKWLTYHRDLGIQHFFVRMENSDGWEDFLKSQKDITYELGKTGTDNYHTLQERQSEFVDKMIPVARSKGIEWVFHIDTDELLEGDISVLNTFDKNTKWARIENAEAVFDGTETTCFDAKRFLKCKNGAKCRSYANGKAVARTEDGVFANGPHEFKYSGKGENTEIPFDTLHVLHFESCSFGAWAEKYNNLAGSSSKKEIPFPFYNESIQAAKQAYDLYKKSVMPDTTEYNTDDIYEKK